MRYAGMPSGMWLVFARSFQTHLVSVLGYDKDEAKQICAAAKPRYRSIIRGLPTFERKDRFAINIVNCALFSSILLSLPKRPSLEEAVTYYGESMMCGAMRWFCRMSGRRKFTEADYAAMRDTAALRAADRNPYSWNMDFLPYPNNSGYEARFTSCGICTLMGELGLFDLVGAMCHLDYTMSEASGVSEFVRRHTLAAGGPYCDCGYKKRANTTAR